MLFVNDQRRLGLSVRDIVWRGADVRLRPLLMKASVAILGLISMFLLAGMDAETQRPLTTIVVSGLMLSAETIIQTNAAMICLKLQKH